MSLDQADINRIAHLARLTIDEKDSADYLNSLNKILNLVDQLQSIDTQNIVPMDHPLDVSQTLREDTVTEFNERDSLQKCAPLTEQGLFLVPKVIE